MEQKKIYFKPYPSHHQKKPIVACYLEAGALLSKNKHYVRNR